MFKRSGRRDTAKGRSRTGWMRGGFGHGVRASMEALGRLTGYANGSERRVGGGDAGSDPAGAQGTLYLDGGWATFVDGLAQAARDAGVELHAESAGGACGGQCRDNGVMADGHVCGACDNAGARPGTRRAPLAPDAASLAGGGKGGEASAGEYAGPCAEPACRTGRMNLRWTSIGRSTFRCTRIGEAGAAGMEPSFMSRSICPVEEAPGRDAIGGTGARC